MFRNAKVQTLMVLAAGMLVGYVAAAGKLDVFRKAKTLRGGAVGRRQIGERDRPLRRTDGLTKGQMVAMADPKVQALVARAETQNGKKPNILVIMGDDVGWFNIGAITKGSCLGRTPNLDKLAAQGMRFTDYYAEASCTAGRANFITGRVLSVQG